MSNFPETLIGSIFVRLLIILLICLSVQARRQDFELGWALRIFTRAKPANYSFLSPHPKLAKKGGASEVQVGSYRVSQERCPIANILKVDILNYFTFFISTE